MNLIGGILNILMRGDNYNCTIGVVGKLLMGAYNCSRGTVNATLLLQEEHKEGILYGLIWKSREEGII